MNLKIENVGIIKHADVKLNGLTVIAGENDSGKSTVGKLMFSIVKAISRYEQDLNENKEYNIKRLMEEIYLFIRNAVDRNDNKNNFEIFKEAFYPSRFYEDIKFYINGSQGAINNIFESRFELITSQGSESLKKRISPKLEELKSFIFLHEDNQVRIQRALKKVLFSEFYSEISPKGQSKTSTIQVVEGSVSTFSFSVKENEVSDLKMDDIFLFEDVTFIETPIIMQMYEMINAASTLLELSDKDRLDRLSSFSRAKVPLHIKDLVTKLENAQFFALTMFETDFQKIKLLETISSIIGGGFTFEKQVKDFSFSKKNSKNGNFKIKSVNTASGIKAFGIIQLLIQAGVIDPRSLLIIDEPETHLHPKWQVEYARLLVELVKNDISVLVTSHSPYLIQALKVFSNKENISDRTAFYLSEKNETNDFAEIHDVTHNLNRLFTKLSDPLRELV
jgi:predicted ATP-dependent endonuclease of OLD family